jgi:uncharacterized repeat protein (TIGR01451 family)
MYKPHRHKGARGTAGSRKAVCTPRVRLDAEHLTGWPELRASARLPKVAHHCVRSLGWALLALMMILWAGMASAAAPVGAVFENTARASFTFNARAVSVLSNTVSLTVAPLRTTATLTLMQYAPASPSAIPYTVPSGEYSATGLATGPFQPLGVPNQPGTATPFDLSAPIALAPATVYRVGEPIFVRLEDMDQNVSLTTTDTVLVTITSSTGDTEVLRLTETGPSTGVFIAAIPSTWLASPSYDGEFGLSVDGQVTAAYTDAVDGAIATDGPILVDPLGIVFDTQTGLTVNGASVTIINSATGLPAVVYGDDGVSVYPSTVSTGGTVIDSSGRTYTLPAGMYRFPYIPPGTYRLEVDAVGYAAPSTVPDATLQGLPGAPYQLVTGSRGEDFTILVGAVTIDLPVDPSVGGLFVRKTVNRPVVSIGDFIQYTVVVTETIGSPVWNARIVDTLPPGFRYQAGSIRYGGVAGAEPTITSDARTMTISLGGLSAGQVAKVTYVLEVGAGARLGKATNEAYAAADPAVTSNTAHSDVTVREDLIRSTNFIFGRVVADNCGSSDDSDDSGLAGVRLYLEDGSYVVTDDKGLFHFEGVRTGTHVIQLDEDSIPPMYELVLCEDSNEFSGSPNSRFVELHGGTIWRTDFNLKLRARKQGTMEVRMHSNLNGGTVEYRIPVTVGVVDLKNVRMSVMLPDEATYITGTSMMHGKPIPDPRVFGNVLQYDLGEIASGGVVEVMLDASIPEEGEVGNLTTKSMLTFDTPVAAGVRTGVMENVIERVTWDERLEDTKFSISSHFASASDELTDEYRAELDRLADMIDGKDIVYLYVSGHTDDVPPSPETRKRFINNYALSRARAMTVANYLKHALKLTDRQVVVIGKGSDEPLVDENTEADRSINRRVEIRAVWKNFVSRYTLDVEQETSAVMNVQTTGVRLGEDQMGDEYIIPVVGVPQNVMPEFDDQWLDHAEPGLAWLWPAEGKAISLPVVNIAVQYRPGRALKLMQDGQEVSGLYYDGTIRNDDGTVEVNLWRGVHLNGGDNKFEVVEYEDGVEVDRIEHALHLSGRPVHVELVPELSRLVADGKRSPVIVVRLTDGSGYPARYGIKGELTVNPPYTMFEDADQLSLETGSHYSIGEDGLAYIQLDPTTETGEVAVDFRLSGQDVRVSTWLTPEERDWIVVGLAEGTVGYDTLSGNMETLGASGGDAEEDIFVDGRIAFFAKGRIKGKWLLTVAYDTAGVRQVGDAMFQGIDPDSYYTLYGDGTQQMYDAPSAEKLYLRLESDQFYAMFGDFNTGMTVTRLARYNRSYTGLKSEYRGEMIEYSAFAVETSQGFFKDEIPGDGTSGLYRLVHPGVVVNTEKVAIEVRDRYQPDVVLTSRSLVRHVDYDIDYARGTLYFREPVPTLDFEFNPVFIVIDYEAEPGGATGMNYGGRGALHLADDHLVVGATYVHEGVEGREADLMGVDTAVSLPGGVTVKAEAARTSRTLAAQDVEGQAYSVEVQHSSNRLKGSVYVREQEAAFGIGQQSSMGAGQRTIGFEGGYRMTDALHLSAQAYQQDALDTSAGHDLAEVSTQYIQKRYRLNLGFRRATDFATDGSEATTDQITAGAQVDATSRLKLRIDHEQALPGADAAESYPTRTALRADYALSDRVSVVGAQEYTTSETTSTETSRLGLMTKPWEGGEFNTNMERQFTENGTRLISNFGLRQHLKLSDALAVSGSLDHSRTLRDQTTATPGANDYTAVSLGHAYKLEKAIWRSRLEWRTSDAEDRYGAVTSISGETGQGVGLSLGVRLFLTDAFIGPDKTDANVRFGFVYRPVESPWIILDRADLIYEEQSNAADTYESWRIVNNTHANYHPRRDLQLSFQYAFKYVMDAIGDYDYLGYTDLTGVEWRYNVTTHWDVGSRVASLHSWNSGQQDYVAGLSVGRHFAKGIWVSLGYNVHGFRDRDFSRAGYTAQGLYLQFRMKFDQHSVRTALGWFSGQ